MMARRPSLPACARAFRPDERTVITSSIGPVRRQAISRSAPARRTSDRTTRTSIWKHGRSAAASGSHHRNGEPYENPGRVEPAPDSHSRLDCRSSVSRHQHDPGTRAVHAVRTLDQHDWRGRNSDAEEVDCCGPRCFLCWSSSPCSFLAARTFHAEIIIEATPEEVWSVLDRCSRLCGVESPARSGRRRLQ